MQVLQEIKRPHKSGDQAKKSQGFSRKQRMIAIGVAALIVTIVIATAQVLSVLY